jgi:transcription elongation factor GreA
MSKFPISKKGFEKLEQELKHLKHVERPSVIEAIATAREFGDLSENAEYHAAREKQSFIEGRIIDLEDKMARSEQIDISKLSGDTIKFGATVELIDDETEEVVTYNIVGEYEADITKKRVSIASPIAKALIGKLVGDIVEVSTPKGSKSYEVIKIKYIDLDYIDLDFEKV